MALQVDDPEERVAMEFQRKGITQTMGPNLSQIAAELDPVRKSKMIALREKVIAGNRQLREAGVRNDLPTEVFAKLSKEVTATDPVAHLIAIHTEAKKTMPSASAGPLAQLSTTPPLVGGALESAVTKESTSPVLLIVAALAALFFILKRKR